jgi:hypothetical protein
VQTISADHSTKSSTFCERLHDNTDTTERTAISVSTPCSGYGFLTGQQTGRASMAEPLIGMLQWDLEAQQTLVIGAIGGFFLALGHFARASMMIHSPTPRRGQLFRAHLPLFIILPILGGGLSYLTIGAPGAFLTGLGALAFILTAAGTLPALQAHQERRRTRDVTTDHQAG